MNNHASVAEYIQDVKEQYESQHSREHAYRPALKQLMASFEDVLPVNDPKRSENGNPDFVFLKRSNTNIILGYAEAKDIGVSLDKTEGTNQMERYGGYANLFLTDYLEFRFFKNGEKYKTISLGKVENGELIFDTSRALELANELAAFLELPPERIKSGRRLAEIMGGKARRVRDNVREYLNSDDERNDTLERMYEMMRKMLVHDLSREKFADMYAQTLVYGLFVARYNDKTPESFSRREAVELVPKSNPFLRHFFDHIAGADFDARLGYIVDELCEVFSVSDVKDIVHKHLRIADKTTDAKDPIIHFYEDFLNEYDPAERKRMGAYYTPIPVVRFIIRQVDKILKEEFGITKGLASDEKFTKKVDIGQEVSVIKPGQKRATKTSIVDKEFYRVQVLDPAVGTATFLNETIKFIHEGFKGQEGRWPAYVHDNLLERLHGFELMMAPYTIAHLKLGMTLGETGVETLNDRLGVYLTNTLEEGIPVQQDLFSFGLAQAVSEESRYAAEIKSEKPIMIVMGNPPYSGVSSNETKYANSLINKYKVEPGGQQKLQERKHWLNDDYVKFIAFAEDMIAKNGTGIVAMITNNGYLDNPTFRGMRWRLAKTFDKIYVLDLHGNAKKMEMAPGGGKDENVFDIMQGVGIILAVRTGEQPTDELAKIFHAELLGKRRFKFDSLLSGVEWHQITPDNKSCYFVPKNNDGQAEYENGIRLNDLFGQNVSGVVTMGDSFIVHEDRAVVAERVRLLIEGHYDEDTLNREFGLGKNYAKWVLSNRKSMTFDESKLVKISYRPFDERWTYFDNKVVWRWREAVMKQLRKENVALVVSRQCVGNWQYVFLSEQIGEFNLTGTAGRFGSGYFMPLWLYHDDGTRTANFDRKQLDSFLAKLKPYRFMDEKEDLSLIRESDSIIAAEDVLDYIYAILHSPRYREKYKEFLKIDFPRVPAPTDPVEFNRLADLGHQLRELHLMTSTTANDYSTTFPVTGSDTIEKVRFENNKAPNKERDNLTTGHVYINDLQYVGNVPELAWNLHIGGYQPAQKWLKDRKGLKLTGKDIDHYQKIIKVLSETDRLMKIIDNK